MNTNIPRSEYPRPQFERAAWLNLNGQWTFEIDGGISGHERGLQKSQGFGAEITVPFCPECELSGVGHKDFIESMWYHRVITVPADWSGKRVLLHFGGVDYECHGFVDGVEVGSHYGGSASFYWDLTDSLKPAESHHFVMWVLDRQRSGVQPYGKQCAEYKSNACSYSRTTGIWQTVWLEAVDNAGLERCEIIPDLDGGSLVFRPFFLREMQGRTLEIKVKADGKLVGSTAAPGNSALPVVVKLSEIRPWSPSDPFLYDVEYTVKAGDRIVDVVNGYAGLRKIHIEGDKVFLNNSPLFMRLVLDQGFYRKGHWTAPTDEDLKRDIELSQAAGFNGARLHQKVFEERFHYWADKLGYLTWGEFPSWGVSAFCWGVGDSLKNQQGLFNFLHEWKEVVKRDISYPSIIVWTPTNENWPGSDVEFYKRMMTEIYDVTKQIDPTRPCVDSSGYHHVKTDLWTIHFYRQTAEELEKDLHPENQAVACLKPEFELPAYHGQPFLNDEFGGFLYLPKELTEKFADNTWGYYGIEIKNDDEFVAKIAEQVKVMVNMPECSGFCYTQLTDIEQEQNGIYTYDRKPKAPVEKLYAAFSLK